MINKTTRLIDEAYERLEIVCVGMDSTKMLEQQKSVLSKTNPDLMSLEARAAFNKMIKEKQNAERRQAGINKIMELAGKNFEGCQINNEDDLNLLSISYPKIAEIERG